MNTNDIKKHLLHELQRSLRERDIAKVEVLERTKSLRDSMEREHQRMLKGGTPNSLGIVQSAGPELDRCCAVLWEAEKNLARVKHTYEKVVGELAPETQEACWKALEEILEAKKS